LQSRIQSHRRRGRLRARCCSQRDGDHPSPVRRCPRVFAFLSMPIDTPTLSPSPPHPSLAVSEATRLETRAPPRSPPSSRQRRSLTWSAPPPECSLSCQRPLTRACSLTVPQPTPCSLGGNDIGFEGASALAAVLNETEITHLRCAAAPECSLSCQCPLTRLLSHHPHSTPRSQFRTQRDRRPGRRRARCRPQGDADLQLGVRRRPSVCFCVNAH
jgi:hypothetical protein